MFQSQDHILIVLRKSELDFDKAIIKKKHLLTPFKIKQTLIKSEANKTAKAFLILFVKLNEAFPFLERVFSVALLQSAPLPLVQAKVPPCACI